MVANGPGSAVVGPDIVRIRVVRRNRCKPIILRYVENPRHQRSSHQVQDAGQLQAPTEQISHCERFTGLL